MKIRKKLLTLALSGALALSLMPGMGMAAPATAEDTSAYTAPSTLDVETAVKCNNGTFVGKETDGLIIWKGIPYATQPVGGASLAEGAPRRGR